MATTLRKRKAKASEQSYPWPLVLHTRPALDLSEDQFVQLCQLNRDLQIERTAEGDWSIMTPVVGSSGRGEARIITRLSVWAEHDGTGQVFSSSAGFRLPNGAVRSPDASWVPNARLEQLSPPDWERFLPLCPDFVLELRSPSDRLEVLHVKMAEYLTNGARLGWLLDPEPRHVYVYRPDADVERLDNPETVAGEPVLPGFVLTLREVW